MFSKALFVVALFGRYWWLSAVCSVVSESRVSRESRIGSRMGFNREVMKTTPLARKTKKTKW
jgi:hypothetical protein